MTLSILIKLHIITMWTEDTKKQSLQPIAIFKNIHVKTSWVLRKDGRSIWCFVFLELQQEGWITLIIVKKATNRLYASNCCLGDSAGSYKAVFPVKTWGHERITPIRAKCSVDQIIGRKSNGSS